MLQDDEEAHLNKQQLRREFLQIMQKPFEEALECYKEFVLKVVYATWFDEKVAQIPCIAPSRSMFFKSWFIFLRVRLS